ncbi:MAG: LysE family transporter [Sporomusaceae bacterium]|nr:LysE family transporter [Sporomusaceae bacterium]
MGMALFLQGLILGFLIAAPVGPIGVLCIRRTLAHGRRSGFVSGLGTATADAIYGCIAAFGMTAAGQLLFAYQPALRLGGGLFLLYLGWGILRAKPPVFAGEDGSVRLIGDYVSAFILTLTNPLTIMTFAAVFAGVGIGESGGIYGLALLLVGGVFCGSTLWWLALTIMADHFRTKLHPNKLVIVNRLAGSLVIGFGILSILSSGAV